MRKTAWPQRVGIATLALALAVAGPALAKEYTSTSEGGDRAWLGIAMQGLTPELRDGISYRGPGVLVSRVVPDGPADRAGLRKGDIVTSFNGRTVDSPEALSDLVGQGKVGQSASVRIVREGRTQTLTVKLAARSEDEDQDKEMEGGGPDTEEPGDLDIHVPRDLDLDLDVPGMVRWMGRGRLGVRVEPLNADLGSYFSVPEGKGVLVVQVMKDTPAERAGLKAGDVITTVGERPVSDPEDLVRALGTDAGKVSLGIVRKGGKRTVEATLDKSERAMHIRRGEGPMGLRDGVRLRSAPDQQREIDELRRQIEELRKRLDQLQHD